MTTTVKQAMDAVTTYIEGATNVNHSLKGILSMDRHEYEDSVQFHNTDANRGNYWELVADYADIDITGKDGGRINPFSLVMTKMGINLRMHINPELLVTGEGDLISKDVWLTAESTQIVDIRKCPIDFVDNMVLEAADSNANRQIPRTGEVLVTVHYQWEHPGHGSNGSTVYFWIRQGHIFRVDCR